MKTPNLKSLLLAITFPAFAATAVQGCEDNDVDEDRPGPDPSAEVSQQADTLTSELDDAYESTLRGTRERLDVMKAGYAHLKLKAIEGGERLRAQLNTTQESFEAAVESAERNYNVLSDAVAKEAAPIQAQAKASLDAAMLRLEDAYEALEAEFEDEPEQEMAQ